MLKEVIQILLIAFFLILCYDTIDICLNQINSKIESELLIVKHEIEEHKPQVESTTLYETYDFPVWPIAFGFSCAFCSVLCHFILPAKSKHVERATSEGSPHRSLSRLNKGKKIYKHEEDELRYYEEMDDIDDSKNHCDIVEDEVVYPKDLGLITSQDSSPDNDSKTDLFAQLDKAEQEKSFMNICIPNFFHDEIFPAQPSLNVINNMGLPAATARLIGEENNRRRHFPKTVYEKNCEILAVNSGFFQENASQRSDDSNDSISFKQEHIMGLISMLSNDVTKPCETSDNKSDKSVNVQLLTYNDDDIKNIEKRLENIEYGLKISEEKAKEWGDRINMAETELVDLHEQMYTIFSKFEEEKKTNYIIVSKVSKDTIFAKEQNIFEAFAEESDEVEQVRQKKDDDVSMDKIDEDMASARNPESALSINDSSEEESEYDEQSANDSKSYYEDNQKSIEDSTEVILTELKQKSIALEALLESKPQINTYHPKKKIPQLSVHSHIIPPYKRSSFAGTDSKADLRKRRLNIRTPNSGNDLFWRTRM